MSDIEITQVENGYILKRTGFLSRTNIFPTFKEMIDWLASYYDEKMEVKGNE